MNEKEDFLKIISAFENKRLLVIGDIIVDQYLRGTVNKIAPDAPVPIVDQYSDELYLGGALNVARCIRELRGQVCLCSAIGNDDEGKFVLETSIKDWDIDVEGIFTVDDVHTTLNTRVTGNNQHMIRITRNIDSTAITKLQEQVKSFLLEHRHEYDAIIITDYDKGFITPEIVEFVVATFGKKIPIVVRPLRKHFNYYNDVTAVILHRKTAEKLLEISMINETSIRNSGLRILRMLNPQAVLITWIEEGFHIFPREGEITFFPSNVSKIPNLLGYRDMTYDDTVTSVFTLGLSLNIDLTVNTELTLKAAESYVSRPETNPISYEELSLKLKS
jgi:D-beta-D-heptose 7-phosphate kinase/D-beta-D-heptose 1-phosphate adenosyltransferase